MGLNSSEFNYIRSTAESLMLDRCVIHRMSLEQDGQGGFKNTGYQAVQTNVPCRMATLRDSETVDIGDREHAANALFLTVPWDQDVRSDDRIVYEEEWFDVIEVRANSYDSALRCRLQARD